MSKLMNEPGIFQFLMDKKARCRAASTMFGIALAVSFALTGLPDAMAQNGLGSGTPSPVKPINELAIGDVDVQKIAAIVNDHPITEFDVFQRLALIVSQAGFQLTDNDIKQMREQVLRSLIDETLKLEEALEFELSPDPKEVDAQLKDIAAQSNLTLEQVTTRLREQNISIKTLSRQISAEVVWNEIVGGRFSKSISITQQEIDAVYQRTIANANKPQYRVFEIQYRVDSPEHDAEVRGGMAQLWEQIRQGADFRSVAQQISHSPSAAQGGDVGWIQDGEMAPELNTALRNMNPGEVSAPIRTAGGYFLLMLADRRMIGGVDPAKSKVSVQQLIFPLAPETPQDQIQAAGNYLLQASQTIKSCKDLVALKERFPNAAISDVETMTIGELDEVFQNAVIPLQAGEASAPVLTNQGFHIIGVCTREDNITNMPNRERIENQLANQQMTMMARRYLRDLRNDAVVEIR